MKRFWYYFINTFLWFFIANGLIALGFVANTQHSLYLPQYGQGYWWACWNAFAEAPENILFVILGIVAFIFLIMRCDSHERKHTGVYKQ